MIKEKWVTIDDKDIQYTVQSPGGAVSVHVLSVKSLEKGQTFLNECFKFGWKIIKREEKIKESNE